MIKQTVLGFKTERTEERLTSHSGLIPYYEFMKAIGVEEAVNRHMPKPGSGNGYPAIEYIKPISLMQYGGGQVIEDIREIRNDSALRKVMNMEEIPSTSAIGDWLRRMGESGGIEGIEKVIDETNKRRFKKDSRKKYTLIIDPTIIESDKHEAKMTYMGFKGYRPVIAVIKELDMVLSYEFKEGNDNGGRLETIKKAFSKIPYGKEIGLVLLDSEYYTNEVMDYLNEKGVKWAIAVDKDTAVMKVVKGICEAEWQTLKTKEGIATDREVSETVHATNGGKLAFRLIAIRWKNRQQDLFNDTYNYHCIATNMESEEQNSQEVVWTYNERATIENHISGIKSGVGLERLPSGDFKANAVYFAIGILTYNLFQAQKALTMPEEWRHKTIKSIRWMFVETPAKLIKHGRQIILKIAATIEKYRTYIDIRRKTYELSLA